jgi:hypothetical protein
VSALAAEIDPEAFPSRDRLFTDIAQAVRDGPLLGLSQMSRGIGPFGTEQRQAIRKKGLKVSSSHRELLCENGWGQKLKTFTNHPDGDATTRGVVWLANEPGTEKLPHQRNGGTVSPELA